MSEEVGPMTDDQLAEGGRLFMQPFVDHGVTKDDYQIIRQDPAFKALLQGPGDYVRRFIAQRDSVSSYLCVNALPQYHAKANTALAYDWSKRGSEETRLALIARAFVGAGLGITDVTLVDSVVAMPAWQTCLVVSPIDLLRQQGIDPEKEITPKRYCRLVKPLCHALPGVQVWDYLNGQMGSDGARLEEQTLAAWLTLPTTQEKGQPLIVRRMSVNPAIWFDCNGTICNLAPLHTPKVFANLPVSNKVKRVLPGDLIMATSLFHGEPHLIAQIKAGTCPRSDIPGTEIRYDGRWSIRPYLRRYDDEAWLYNYCARNASGGFGSVGAAGE